MGAENLAFTRIRSPDFGARRGGARLTMLSRPAEGKDGSRKHYGEGAAKEESHCTLQAYEDPTFSI